MQGYGNSGYYQQGYQGGGDQSWQQQQWAQMQYQQQMWAQQQGQQMQGQQMQGGNYYGGQQQTQPQQQQQQQMQQQQQQQMQQQQKGGSSKGGYGGGGGGTGGAVGGGGGKGRQGGAERGSQGGKGAGVTTDERQSRGDDRQNRGGGKGGGGKGNGEMTLAEYKAEQERKAAEKKKKLAEQQAKAKEEAARRAAAFDAEPAAEELQAEEPRTEDVQPAKVVEPVAEVTVDDPLPVAEVKVVEPQTEEVAVAEAADEWEKQVDEEEQAPQKEEPPIAEEVPEEVPPPAAVPKTVAPAPETAEAAEPEDEIAEVVQTKAGEARLPDPRMHLNVVFMGHVDAGKSTTCGNILYLSGCVDDRTVKSYKKEAADKNRESWFLAYIMDTNEEEKAKGKTVEVGRAHFETANRRFTILDAPGHKSYVPNMISGASQADIGVLIISARKGEFETGFERGGQTREHALLAKTLGVEKLCVTVNKMDDPSVEWAQSRFDEIVSKLAPFLKQSGFKEDQVMYIPISGLAGDNVKERQGTPAWFSGKTLLDLLDKMELEDKKPEAPLRIPMLEGYKDMGQTMAIGKIEQGSVKPGLKCIVMPTGNKCTVASVFINDEEMQYANAGENVTLKMAGIGEDLLGKGYVLCAIPSPVPVVTKFKAQLQVVELPPERPVLTAGYRCVIHIHVSNEECEIHKLYESIMMKDKKKEKNPKYCREGSILTCSITLARPTALESFKTCPQLGRFTLRDEGRTIAIGKITELPSVSDEKGKK